MAGARGTQVPALRDPAQVHPPVLEEGQPGRHRRGDAGRVRARALPSDVLSFRHGGVHGVRPPVHADAPGEGEAEVVQRTAGEGLHPRPVVVRGEQGGVRVEQGADIGSRAVDGADDDQGSGPHRLLLG